MAGVGSNPALVICETTKVLLSGVSGGFLEVVFFLKKYEIYISFCFVLILV